jgi:hypothetical protein
MDNTNLNKPYQNMEMGWDDTIQEDGQELILLDEGDYNFIVTNFERGRFPGGQKIPACNKATITVQIETDKGLSVIKFDLLLYRSVEWRISSFFRCIGQKKHGEKLTMNWNTVIGSVGRAHVTQRKYTNNYGEEKTVNDIGRFIDYDPKFFNEMLGAPVEISDDDLPF